jgi:DNA-binding NarL/FixJ family response regulator
VFLADLNEVGSTGVARLAALTKQIPGSAIVLLGLRTTPQLRRDALAAGASEFVGMDEGSDALLATIRRVAAQVKPSIASIEAVEGSKAD